MRPHGKLPGFAGRRVSRKNTWSVRDRLRPSSTPLVIQSVLDTFARHFAADNFLGRAHVLRGRVDRVTRFGVDVDFSRATKALTKPTRFLR